MENRSVNPVYIQCCGFHSAMGNEHEQIHHVLSGDKDANMIANDEILNTGDPTVIGRVKETLPTLPEHMQRYSTRNNQLALSALLQIAPTIQQAIEQYGASRVAVVVGTSTSGISDGEEAYESLLAEGDFPEHYHYQQQEIANSSQFIADYFQLTGPCYAISTACSSSGRVFITAQRLLRSGLVDAVIVGGCDTVCRLTLNGFRGLEALSKQLCRPFSEQRDGINIGEAAAFMLLSNEQSDIALLGAGESSDAHHISAPHPEGHGAEVAMRNALEQAGLSIDDIGYINAHGTATELNDRMESKAIQRIFGQATPVSSTKMMTGHTLGAASATEAAIAWHILKYRLSLPIQNCSDKAEDININLIEQPTKLNGKAILSNSFAFGGNNISLIFGYSNE